MVEVLLTYVIGPVLVAAVGGGFSWAATQRARDAAHRATTAANIITVDGPTSAQLLSGLTRLEGKVDGLREDVRLLSDWRAVHEAQHADAARRR